MNDPRVYWMTDPEADAIQSPFVRQPAYADLAAELAETQRQLKLVAPVGRHNGRNIEEWAKYGAALEAALQGALGLCKTCDGRGGWEGDGYTIPFAPCPDCSPFRTAAALPVETEPKS